MSDEPVPIHASEYVAAEVGRQAFHCPFCAVYSQHAWQVLSTDSGQFRAASRISRSTCGNCREHTYWLASDDFEYTLLWPLSSVIAPPAHPDMPSEPKADYDEARGIVERSPRGAVALLRLATQKLMMSLDQPGKNINDDIKTLVEQGLPARVQQALDTVRVTGNNAVHPGQIDLRDDRDRAVALFSLLNYIVEQQITQPKELDAIYGSLPASSRAQIEKRDAPQTALDKDANG